ncbi:MAG: OmpA family protein [Alteromonadaceae bacterium]|nr:OmpA family protein [Alteromonadaceae bacterium]
MKIKLPNKLTITFSSIALSSMFGLATAIAADQPKAEDLVGNVYGGIHGLHIQTDDERLMTADPLSDMDYGNGFGGEVGYRWLPSTEFRFNYSKFSLTSANDGYDEPDGASTAIDVLYFPNNKNFYLLTGVNNLDIGNSQISGNLGAGYRYYLSERSAIYFEGKANYQFSEHYDEFTSQIGFVYFFGDNAKPVVLSKPVKLAVEKKIVVPDTDKDGVVDNKDQCANTPLIDKVDFTGCTLFTNRIVTKQLLVNFDHNKAIVKPQYDAEITAIADILSENKTVSLTIEGHTSRLGSDAYNKVLSQKRANAIINLLINKHGIDASRLSAVGYGEERLINPDNSSTAHRENRRIEAKIEISYKEAIKR